MKENDVKPDDIKRLANARTELVAAREKANVIAGKEDAASTSADAYALWRSARDQAAAEVERLLRLVTSLESGAEALAAREAAEALKARIAAARKLNADAADRSRTEGMRLATALKSLVRDHAIAVLEAAATNKLLPPDEPMVLDADFLARGRPGVPRKDLKTETISLWVREDTGALIGDQDRVVASDATFGTLLVDKTFNVPCARRKFRSTLHNPAEPPILVAHLHSSLRLPDFTGPGMVFEGNQMILENVAALDLQPGRPEKAEKPAKRSTQTELVPIEPTPQRPRRPALPVDASAFLRG